jgi:MYXO-CTERM domain-containing protein
MRASAALIALALLSFAGSADAYCRTSTCGSSECEIDPDCGFCLIGGKPLYWPRGCVSYSVHEGGSKRRQIDAETTRRIVEAAFARWIGVACGTGTPGIMVYDFGLVSCDKQEYNQDEPNANLWVHRDDEWPYISGGQTLALTTLTFNVETGEIYDADVEINSFENPLTISDTDVGTDLESIIVHEAGHFLGLSHSCDGQATMFANYVFGETKLRSLEADDIAGICAIYPPGKDTRGCNPTPRHGFSRECASGVEKGCCTTAPGQPGPHGPWALGAALFGAAALAARRRSGRSRDT